MNTDIIDAQITIFSEQEKQKKHTEKRAGYIDK